MEALGQRDNHVDVLAQVACRALVNTAQFLEFRTKFRFHENREKATSTRQFPDNLSGVVAERTVRSIGPEDVPKQ